MLNEWLNDLTSIPAEMAHYQQERAAVEATELLCRIMEEEGVTRSALAARLGKSQPHVSHVLASRVDLTLRELSDMLHALGQELHVSAPPIARPPQPPEPDPC